jgi:predicted alpha-1,6-mannanase (GH76 family)
MIHRRQNRAIRKVIMNHQNTAEAGWFLSNKYYPSKSWVLMHVLALELLRLSK